MTRLKPSLLLGPLDICGYDSALTELKATVAAFTFETRPQ